MSSAFSKPSSLRITKYQIFDHLTAFLQLTGNLGGFKIIQSPQKAIITDYPSPIFNYVHLQTSDHALINKLKQRNIPFLCYPSKNTEDEFEEIMNNHNLMKADFVITHSFDDLSGWEYQPHPDIKVHKITTQQDLRAFDKISSIVFQHPENLAFNFLKSTLSHPEIHCFLASVENETVGCGVVSLADQQAGLYWGGVLPDFRNKGVATALTEYRMNFIKEQGYSSIIVQNMTPSIHYYQRIGFKPIGGMPVYMFTGAV